MRAGGSTRASAPGPAGAVVTERVTIVGHVVEAPHVRRSARGLTWALVRVESVAGHHVVVEATAFGAFAERCAACLTAGDRVVIVGHQGKRGVVADEVAISVRHHLAYAVRQRPPDETPAPVLVVPPSVVVPTDPTGWEDDF